VEPQPRQIEWLSEWDGKIAADAQAKYMENELRRLQAAGEPLLYAALTLPLVSQQDLAKRVLRRELGVASVLLRLVAGARPPEADADGVVRLEPRKRGHVLRAKVGTRGGARAGEPIPTEVEARRYAASARATLFRSAQGGYVHLEIGRDPTPVPLEDAEVILRAYGYGINERRYRRRGRHPKPALDGLGRPMVENGAPVMTPDGRVDLWLVEEVTQATLDEERARPAASPAKAGKAA
jgi:hypothetical protein